MNSRVQPTPRQLRAFENELAREIERRNIASGWDVLNPELGWARRTISCDIAPPSLLANAAHCAGFTLLPFDLPTKTIMWVDPGKVEVIEAYGRSKTTIFES
ncbi:hypothetical protein PV371_38360 [Streptomyces sp. TX20-6-3]|uniref:hypothetical protein n=1 Tax=Streptomyces sp. TX20-6-3 TaxID=3028705 RepID=UPI0029A77CA5|nr:hypothetical protein [Streptomyces sp. TX20-6-3]MDX2565404.1 hypothetical protein [Streptomyces sp. TX20-6-3]